MLGEEKAVQADRVRRPRVQGTFRPSAGPDGYRAHDLVVRARHERARWLSGVIRSLATRIETAVPSPLAGALRRRRAAGIGQLLALDERTLRDIGLGRDDLMAVAHGDMTLEQLNARRTGRPSADLRVLRPRNPEERAAPTPDELPRAA